MSVAVRQESFVRRLRRYGTPRGVAIGGIVLGLLGIWLALPPWLVSSAGAPIALGIAAAFAGLWAVTRDEKRLGWWALTVAVAGTAFAVWVQGRSDASVKGVLDAGLIAATFRFATPLAYAAMGGIFSERSGVVNIGLEGMMLTGAFFGIWAAAWSGTWVVGLLLAMVFGGLMALVHAVFSIHLRADQIVSGTAINFLALGLTGYLFRDLYGDQGTPVNVSRVPDVTIPGLKDVPFVGDVFGQLNLMIWLVFALVIAVWVVLFKTPIGLRIRSVGEHPRAAETVGISVFGVRYAAVVLSGMLAALGGAYLSIGFIGSFDENMTAGRGFIALAAVIFGKWRPFGAFGACLLFGFASALANALQTEASVSVNLLSTLPYVLTLVALVGLIGRSRPPAAVGRPYVKQ
ncbi:MAG: ABC transporter permease [Actinobacteria bacterium]|nr:MAG: ABC transporter permease [Actinomycetota bacterium]